MDAIKKKSSVSFVRPDEYAVEHMNRMGDAGVTQLVGYPRATPNSADRMANGKFTSNPINESKQERVRTFIDLEHARTLREFLAASNEQKRIVQRWLNESATENYVPEGLKPTAWMIQLNMFILSQMPEGKRDIGMAFRNFVTERYQQIKPTEKEEVLARIGSEVGLQIDYVQQAESDGVPLFKVVNGTDQALLTFDALIMLIMMSMRDDAFIRGSLRDSNSTVWDAFKFDMARLGKFTYNRYELDPIIDKNMTLAVFKILFDNCFKPIVTSQLVNDDHPLNEVTKANYVWTTRVKGTYFRNKLFFKDALLGLKNNDFLGYRHEGKLRKSTREYYQEMNADMVGSANVYGYHSSVYLTEAFYNLEKDESIISHYCTGLLFHILLWFTHYVDTVDVAEISGNNMSVDWFRNVIWFDLDRLPFTPADDYGLFLNLPGLNNKVRTTHVFWKLLMHDGWDSFATLLSRDGVWKSKAAKTRAAEIFDVFKTEAFQKIWVEQLAIYGDYIEHNRNFISPSECKGMLEKMQIPVDKYISEILRPRVGSVLEVHLHHTIDDGQSRVQVSSSLQTDDDLWDFAVTELFNKNAAKINMYSALNPMNSNDQTTRMLSPFMRSLSSWRPTPAYLAIVIVRSALIRNGNFQVDIYPPKRASMLLAAGDEKARRRQLSGGVSGTSAKRPRDEEPPLVTFNSYCQVKHNERCCKYGVVRHELLTNHSERHINRGISEEEFSDEDFDDAYEPPPPPQYGPTARYPKEPQYVPASRYPKAIKYI